MYIMNMSLFHRATGFFTVVHVNWPLFRNNWRAKYSKWFHGFLYPPAKEEMVLSFDRDRSRISVDRLVPPYLYRIQMKKKFLNNINNKRISRRIR